MTINWYLNPTKNYQMDSLEMENLKTKWKNCFKSFNWRIFHADCIDVLKSLSFEKYLYKEKD